MNVSSKNNSASDHAEERVLEALEQWCRVLDEGRPFDRDSLLAQYEDVAPELAKCLNGLDLVHSTADRLANGDLCDHAKPGGGVTPISSSPQPTLGDFHILREIGRGGMGVVYEAEQRSLGRRVALKVLPFAATLGAQQIQRFRNEARAAAALRHPNIVGVYSVGVEQGVNYLAMELVEGRTLAQLLADIESAPMAGPPSATASTSQDTSPAAVLSTLHDNDRRGYYRQVARIVADLADALHYAHSLGIIHRDVKPANVLIDQQSHVWLTDFGLARLEADAGVTMSGDMLGTLRYMSPEQAAGKPGLVDYRSDIHSLGATLYELLVHRPAFEGQDRSDLLRRIADQSPTSISRIDPRVPRSLEIIVSKTMEKDRNDRYESAEALAADLRAFADDRPILARPPTLTQCATRWGKRHTAAVTTTFGVMLLCIIGLLSATTIIGRERSVAERHAAESSDNFQLALSALEQTLTESVAGNLVVQYENPKHKELARRGIAFYEHLAEINNVDPAKWATYRLLICHQLLKNAFHLKSSRPTEAEAAYSRAVTAAEQLHNASKDDPRYLAMLICCLDDHSVFLYEQGRTNEAKAPSQRAGILAQNLLSDHQNFLPANYLVGMNHYNTGVRLWNSNHARKAETAYHQALEHLNKAFRLEPTEERNIYGLAACEYNLALVHASRDETNQAEKHWYKSLGFWKGLILMRPLWSEYPSRVGATLSNLAVLAKQADDYQRCRQFTEEALSFQKRALQIDPVYPLAEQFMQKHYRELSLALSALGDHEALAAIAEERVTYLPDIAEEYCNAAISLGDCLEQLCRDGDNANGDRDLLKDGYAKRAFAILDDASARFKDNLAVFTIGRAYTLLGDGCLEMERIDDARRAWLSAERQYERAQAAVEPTHRHEFDEYLEVTRQKVNSLGDLE